MNNEIAKPKPGRPRYDASLEIAAHFRAGLDKGLTVTQIAREGLFVFEFGSRPIQPVCIKKMHGKYLEAAFREIKQDYMPPWLRPEHKAVIGVPNFMGRPLRVPIGVASLGDRKAGRPANNRH